MPRGYCGCYKLHLSENIGFLCFLYHISKTVMFIVFKGTHVLKNLVDGWAAERKDYCWSRRASSTDHCSCIEVGMYEFICLTSYMSNLF